MNKEPWHIRLIWVVITAVIAVVVGWLLFPVLNSIRSEGTSWSSVATHVPTMDTAKLVNRNSGKVLGVYAASTADGANVVQWSDNGSSNQQWGLVSVSNGYYKLVNRNGGKVLGVYAASTADGANVVQWSDNGSYDQQWSLAAV